LELRSRWARWGQWDFLVTTLILDGLKYQELLGAGSIKVFSVLLTSGLALLVVVNKISLILLDRAIAVGSGLAVGLTGTRPTSQRRRTGAHNDNPKTRRLGRPGPP